MRILNFKDIKPPDTPGPVDIKTGDLVLVGKYRSQEGTLDDEKYFIMVEDEVLAVIDDVGATKKE